MPIYDRQKYACDSCIKGHRVSGCQHTDRELKLIAPKGRPVKQCEHCRGARKNKSHHAKCDCGDRKDETKGDIQGEAFEEFSIHASPDLHAVDARACRCHYGAPCICGVKKGSQDPSAQHPVKTRPKLTTARSENTLMVFANGHHKPSHRLNNAAHTSGAPYKVPRPHSLHGPSLPHHSHNTINRVSQPAMAQFSADDSMLFCTNPRSLYSAHFTAQRSVDSLPLPTQTNVPDATATFFNGTQASGTGEIDALNDNAGLTSPSYIQQTNQNAPLQWPWSSSELPLMNQSHSGSLTTSPVMDGFNSTHLDWSRAPATLTPFSANDLPLNVGQFNDAHIQPVSNSGESARRSAPGLTASSSGAQSEVGDATFSGDLDLSTQPAHAAPLIQWDKGFIEQAMAPSRLDSAAMLSSVAQLPSSAPATDDNHPLNSELFRRNMDNNSYYLDSTESDLMVAIAAVEQGSSIGLYQGEHLHIPLNPQPLTSDLSSAPASYNLPTFDPVTIRRRSNSLPSAPSNENIDWLRLFESNAGGSSLPYQPLQPLDIEPAAPSSNSWQLLS